MNEAFESYYRGIWGSRWDSLRKALMSDNERKISPEGLIKPYFMDETSIETASILPIAKGGNVLDMCAAPGGKTLVIALRLGGTGRLVSNDRSAERRGRLRRNIEECLPDDLKKNIRVSGHDSSKWGLYEKNVYDSILLDAPCSSERHVITSAEHLSLWSESRPKRLRAEQFSMICSAYIALKRGGYLLYSTCSINRDENEGIIERLLKKHDDIEEVSVTLSHSEKLSHGCVVLPDASEGRGPMYACLVRKL